MLLPTEFWGAGTAWGWQWVSGHPNPFIPPQMRVSKCLHDPAAAVKPCPAAPTLPRLQLGPQPAQGHHGTQPCRAAAPGELGAVRLSVCSGAVCPPGWVVCWLPPRSPPAPLQAQSALLAPGPVSLVLDEDGTAVETEAFFQTLEEDTVLMALSKGQTWAASKVSAPLFVPSASHTGS